MENVTKRTNNGIFHVAGNLTKETAVFRESQPLNTQSN